MITNKETMSKGTKDTRQKQTNRKSEGIEGSRTIRPKMEDLLANMFSKR